MNRSSIIYWKILIYSILLCTSEFLYSQIDIENFEYFKYSANKSLFKQKEYNSSLDNYDVKFYKLDIEVNNDSIFVKGNVLINALVVNNPLDTFVIELNSNMVVDSIKINENLYSNTFYDHYEDFIYVSLFPSPIETGNIISARIYYSGPFDVGDYYSGIYNATDASWGKKVTYTLSEPYSAKNWFPCKQVLTDKADSVYVFITIPSGLKAGSNGLLDTIVSLSEEKVRYEWKSNYPIAYYLISMSISDYQEYNTYASPEGLDDSILVQNYIYSGSEVLSTYKEVMDDTDSLIELFSDLYTMYPFHNEKYGHCQATFNGGMEHQTMTTIGSQAFVFNIVAHELGHMWFGDYVTCATWQDIWINEGFASYTEYLAYQYTKSQSEADGWMDKAHKRALAATSGSIYIPEDEISNESRIFNNALSYKKGASIIHMMRFELQNDTIFFKTLQNFIEEYCDSIATGIDFKNILEETSGMDFTDFFNQWYFGEGYPIFNITWWQKSDTLSITSYQTTSSANTPLFKTSVEYKIYHGGNDTTIRVYQSENLQSYDFYFPEKIDSVSFDPNGWILKILSGISVIKDNKLPEKEFFTIYPNPCQDKLIIKFQETISYHAISIFDVSGNIVYRERVETPVCTVDVKKLPAGLFILTVNTDKVFYSKMFVKQ